MPPDPQTDDKGAQPSVPSAQPQMPQLALPKGGGAIQGIGEKFSTNAMTGTGSLTVPISTSKTRSDFAPALALSYDSGGGNGAFGIGWSLSLPHIVRKTDKGLPRYRDDEESDVFILSGSEDLVPLLRQRGDGEWENADEERDGFRVRFYRPRVEGLFARIERWTRLGDGDIHWRSVTRENVLTIYGDSPESRIADPREPGHVFDWLISASYDGRGNAVRYLYAAEDRHNVDLAKSSERHRPPPANRYLKRVFYGNRQPLLTGDGWETADWMFEVVFDFGDEDYRQERRADNETFVTLGSSEDSGGWTTRHDPFSTSRSGFEIRTYRLCRRALMIHRFPHELGTGRCLVRATEFAYDERPIGSFLTTIVQSGYTRLSDGAYLKKSLPAVELGYTPSPLEDDEPGPFPLKEADAANLPQGIDGTDYRWVDLDGEGISGVLSEEASGWYYKRNLGDGRFAPSRLVAQRPALSLGARDARLLDVAGDGQLNLVDLAPGLGGFYERVAGTGDNAGLDAGWGRFRRFRELPVLHWNDANLRFIDLTGDGIADILITEDVAFRWYPSLGADGYGAEVRVPPAIDENDGPRVVFADPTQSVYLADLSGDGLTDIVRIRNGEVCYWPNRGYGRFGAKIVMDRSPWFDAPGLFDSRRIRLADTDGSGTTDILYIGTEQIHLYLNEVGNALSPRKTLRGLPAAGNSAISVVDFLGRGTVCLVWSSPWPTDAMRPLRYADLMRGVKPHLLCRIANNLGAETAIAYASSTEFYLADRAAGRHWVTPLPFPVHVVTRVETWDAVSRHRFVSTTTYHHGHYDAVEREFRGFGRVDRLDSEQFATGEERLLPAGDNDDAVWRLPPVLVKTWYHTGVFIGSDRISRHLAHEYYREPDEPAAMRLDDTIIPAGLLPEEAREACRALKGLELREETYALDGSEAAARPYTVAEGNATVRMFQPRAAGNRHCVVFTHARENRTLDYERRLYPVGGGLRADPRTTQSVVLAVDDYGNTLTTATIAYGRRFPDPHPLLSDADRACQAAALATLVENTFTNAVDRPAAYRTPLLAETRTYELVRLPAASSAEPLRFDEIVRFVGDAGDGRHNLPFEDIDGEGAIEAAPYRRLFQASRTLFRADDLERILPLGVLESLALTGENRALALTPGLIARIYGDKLADPEPILRREGGYWSEPDGSWWARSGRVFYSPDARDPPAAELAHARRHFFLPVRLRDAFGNVSFLRYDAHDLTPVETHDPVGNVVRERLDYRTLQPREVTDPNGNRSQAAYDALGRLAGTAVMGKAGEKIGDSLDDFRADLPDSVVEAHLRDPLAAPEAVLANASTRMLYDPFAFARTRGAPQPQPAVTYSLARETHVSDLAPGGRSKVQHHFSYSDGFGREVQKKLHAEPGPIPERGIADNLPRWVGSGWTIFNNKGKPIRQYQPFFSPTQDFEFAAIFGVSSTLVYDPVGRVVATLHPNHTFQKTVFDPWRQETWDLNDTVLIDPRQDPDIGPFLHVLPEEDYRPTWFEQRAGGGLGPAEQEAALNAAAHAGTPTGGFVDALGRPFLQVTHNRMSDGGGETDAFYKTRTTLDIQGNPLAVTDPLGRVATSTDYDAGQRHMRQRSADAGEHWIVNDSAGKPLLRFDSRRHRLRDEYDALRRAVALYIRRGDEPERLVERAEYGDAVPDAEARNLRGRIHRQLDGAGIGASSAYDFKGNLLRSTRQALADYRGEVDWAASPRLDDEVLTSETRYDALNRPTALTGPDSSVIRPGYNEANLLERLDVALKGAAEPTPFVTNIDYDANGQRGLIEYGNGARTISEYDPLTLRIAHVTTTRSGDGARLQDLRYVYDPVGNISSIADAAQQTVYFRNQVVAPEARYRYDALYRLVEARGREHAGRPGRPETNHDDAGRVHLPLPGDGRAMHNYRERYRYDPAGNILELIHAAPDHGNWRRHYRYGEIDRNNRLTSTSAGDVEGHYAYDGDGNMIRMPHLPAMRWNFKDQLAATESQLIEGNGQAPTTFYVYDAGERRARKVTVDAAGRRRAERIYVGTFEIVREYGGDGDSVTLERTSLHVLDDVRRVAIVETRGDESTIRYQFDNHLGSSCLELDADAAILTYEEYYPYGSTSYQAGRSVTETSLKRYRFTGEERDSETGFNYHSARYYAPWLARWTSCDPTPASASAGLYEYGAGNPLRFIDPSGKANTDVVSKTLDNIKKAYKAAQPKIKQFVEEGEVAKYSKQGASRWLDPIKRLGRLTEAEHPVAGAALKWLNKKFSYSGAKTVVINRSVAIAKTVGDNRFIKAVKAGTMDAAELVARSKANFVKAIAGRWAQTGEITTTQMMKDAKQALQVTEEMAKESLPKLAKALGSESGEAGMLLKGAKSIPIAGKVVTGVIIGITVLAASEQLASAAEKNQAPADDAEKMAQTFEKGEKIAGAVATVATLVPGPVGVIAGGAQLNVAIAEAGIQATGGDDRIVAAGKATEQFAKAHGWSDVNAETAGAVAAATTSIAEGAQVLGEVAMGPIGWGILAVRAWKKF